MLTFAAMNYQQTIEYLFSRLPMFSRIGKDAYKADLSNTIKLCATLGDPQDSFKSVHIAGTNGKGSVSHMLASILQSAGYKTGLYTSPHLKDFRERIRIDGKMVEEEFVIAFTEKIKPLIDALEPSFFEITVAMAFKWFAHQEVDIAIIETGLGGRLDSTNIIEPELSVITNIGFDHMNILGDTLEKIATEKAGIIKENVPIVIGESLPQTLPIFQRTAIERSSPLTIATEERQVTDWHWEENYLVAEVAWRHHTDHKVYQLDLNGIYQLKNLLTVLEACHQLITKGWNINEDLIKKGLKHVRKYTSFHGRWEIIHSKPLVVLDVAHNEDGIRELVKQAEITTHRELHIIIGLVKDKEVEKILSILPRHANYYFTKAHIPRAMNESDLLQKATLAGLQGTCIPDVNEALKEAMARSHHDDLIIICGSVFLVGEVIPGTTVGIKN